MRLAIQLSQSMMDPSSGEWGGTAGAGASGISDQSHLISEEDDIQKAIQLSIDEARKKKESPPSRKSFKKTSGST